jgi:hypothetical protein
MIEAFRMGGWGMWLVLASGSALVVASLRWAAAPDRRGLPLLFGLGVVTLASGALGFTTGLIASCFAIDRVAADQRHIVVLGLGESLTNVAFALAFVLVAAVAASLGGWRLARDEAPARLSARV